MKPSIGRIVIYKPTPNDKGQSSSEDGFPAVITRVWSDTCVNLQVLRDFDTPIAVTSVEAAPDRIEPAPERTWYWPPRV